MTGPRAISLADLHEALAHHAPTLALVESEPLPEPVVAVVGAGGGVGATTTALALAPHLGSGRLVGCRTWPWSALAAATTAELGTDAHGWSNGLREDDATTVVIQRAPHHAISPTQLPAPGPTGFPAEATVLDLGWPLAQLTGWLRASLVESAAIVVVAVGTCPGLDQLEATLRELEEISDSPVTAVVRGPHLKRWPRPLRAAAGPRTRTLLAADSWIAVSEDRALHLLGLTSDPLPASVAAAGVELGSRIAPLVSRDHYTHPIHLERTPS